MDVDALEAAGLYDPAAPDAAERFTLLEWLTEQGFSLEELTEGRDRLSGLAAGRVIRPGRRIGIEEVVRLSGVAEERIRKVRRAAGIPGDVPFTEADVDLFAAFEFGRALFGDQEMFQMVRVLGSSLIRLAETAVSMFFVNIEQPLKASKLSQVSVAQAQLEATRALDVLPSVMNTMFRVHMEEAIRRSRATRVESSDTVRLAVGFIDLVGFTPLSQQLDTSSLATLVDDFESTAFDLIAHHDGRVVKLIGDEVMFVTVDASAACAVSLDLVTAYASDAAITPRGAVGVGEVLTRGGDYYGAVVNLASRAAELAVPYEVLTTASVRDDARGSGADLVFEPAGRRILKGFDEPVELFTVTRSRRSSSTP